MTALGHATSAEKLLHILAVICKEYAVLLFKILITLHYITVPHCVILYVITQLPFLKTFLKCNQLAHYYLQEHTITTATCEDILCYIQMNQSAFYSPWICNQQQLWLYWALRIDLECHLGLRLRKHILRRVLCCYHLLNIDEPPETGNRHSVISVVSEERKPCRKIWTESCFISSFLSCSCISVPAYPHELWSKELKCNIWHAIILSAITVTATHFLFSYHDTYVTGAQKERCCKNWRDNVKWNEMFPNKIQS